MKTVLILVGYEPWGLDIKRSAILEKGSLVTTIGSSLSGYKFDQVIFMPSCKHSVGRIRADVIVRYITEQVYIKLNKNGTVLDLSGITRQLGIEYNGV